MQAKNKMFELTQPNRGAASGRTSEVQSGPWALRCLILGLMVGIFALSYPRLLLAALAASALVFTCLAVVRPVHGIGIVILWNYGLWLFTGILSGGIVWASFGSSEFWRGEGRCFFFYLPLVAFSVLRVRREDLQFVVRVVYGLTIVGAILCGLWIMGWGHFFQAAEDAETGERFTSICFIGWLTSHTGAGAFWATVAAFLIAYSWQMQQKGVQLLAIVAACLTISTGGRAATMGLSAAVLWFLLRGPLLQRRTWGVAALNCTMFTACAAGVAISVPEINERMAELFRADTLLEVAATTREPTLRDASGYFHSGAGLAHHNLVIRIFLWKYAVRLFAESPLLGVGFGRFNDPYLRFSGIPHVANLAVEGERYHGSGIRWDLGQLMTSTGNAHNSYLHMLAETGVVGFAIFLYLWFRIYRSCQSCDHVSLNNDRFCRAYAAGCRTMVICLLVAALSGHALAAPSGGILLTTMIGAWVSYSRLFSPATPHLLSGKSRKC